MPPCYIPPRHLPFVHWPISRSLPRTPCQSRASVIVVVKRNVKLAGLTSVRARKKKARRHADVTSGLEKHYVENNKPEKQARTERIVRPMRVSTPHGNAFSDPARDSANPANVVGDLSNQRSVVIEHTSVPRQIANRARREWRSRERTS